MIGTVMPKTPGTNKSLHVSLRGGCGACAVRALRLAPIVLPVGACSVAPEQDLFGSFFPAWILCAAVGVVAAVIVRQILVLIGINDYVLAPPLTYAAIAVAATFLVWLLWYGH
jgi:hypothetical protein